MFSWEKQKNQTIIYFCACVNINQYHHQTTNNDDDFCSEVEILNNFYRKSVILGVNINIRYSFFKLLKFPTKSTSWHLVKTLQYLDNPRLVCTTSQQILFKWCSYIIRLWIGFHSRSTRLPETREEGEQMFESSTSNSQVSSLQDSTNFLQKTSFPVCCRRSEATYVDDPKYACLFPNVTEDWWYPRAWWRWLLYDTVIRQWRWHRRSTTLEYVFSFFTRVVLFFFFFSISKVMPIINFMENDLWIGARDRINSWQSEVMK